MTSRLFLPAAALATAAAAHDAPADPPDVQAHYSETFTECTRDSMATADTVFCIASEAKHQEPKLEQAYVAALKRGCRELDMDYVSLPTDQPPDAALAQYLSVRMKTQ